MSPLRLIAWLLLGSVACASNPDGNHRRPQPTSPGAPVGTPGGAADTGTTTGATTNGTVCASLPPGPLPWDTIDVSMEEDFDFDAEGYALVQSGSAILGRNRYGDQKIVSASVSSDPSGIQVLSTGHVVVGAQDEGAVKVVDPATGGSIVIASGLIQPNGLEIGSDDRVYVSEMTFDGRVSWHDPWTGERGMVLDGTNLPNGVVLSPDEQVLYIGGQAPNGQAGILAVDRIDADTWDSEHPRVVWSHAGGDFDGVEVDICGNIYTVEYTTGRLIRISPDGLNVEFLADLDDPDPWWVEFNSLRWGNGVGGWEPTVLYVTDRNLLFPVEVGIPGKPSPSSVWVP